MKKSQLFKNDIPNPLLFDFLASSCKMNEYFYEFDINSFKRAKFNNTLQSFCDSIQPFYYTPKQKYVTCDHKFTKFITIIRQICKHNNIPYTSKIKYSNNTYFITYYIKNNL